MHSDPRMLDADHGAAQAAPARPPAPRRVELLHEDCERGVSVEDSVQPSKIKRLLLLASAWWNTPAGSRRVPAILISLIFHTFVFLLLALWTVTRQIGNQSTDFHAVASLSKVETNQTELELAASGSLAPLLTETNPDVEPPPTSTVTPKLSALLQSPVDDSNGPRAAKLQQETIQQLLKTTGSNLSASFASSGVEGRSLQERRNIALARGGTLESERAVEAALEWLAAHQLPNGGWSLVHDTGDCNGRCDHPGSKDRFDAAATGLALLAYMGAGYTHRDGKHRETVRRGLYFLQQIMEETQEGGSFLYQSDRGMYNHGIAAFAICEAYQMTLDPDLKRTTQIAVDFTVNAQNYKGGWGYLPKKPGDLTITSWQVMGLKSAYAAQLDIADDAILRIDNFLDTQMSPNESTYGYTAPGDSPTCTAIGMLLRMFRGEPITSPRMTDGAIFVTSKGVSREDVYFNYYATLALFHFGGRLWEDWNPAARDYLISTQETSGHAAGSWYFDNAYGKEGGRLYTTAMAAMTLEVYYRFAPLYQQKDIKFNF